jgi:hypothetical protein
LNVLLCFQLFCTCFFFCLHFVEDALALDIWSSPDCITLVVLVDQLEPAISLCGRDWKAEVAVHIEYRFTPCKLLKEENEPKESITGGKKIKSTFVALQDAGVKERCIHDRPVALLISALGGCPIERLELNRRMAMRVSLAVGNIAVD